MPIYERQKGHNLIKLPKDYTIIDIETTGFSSKFDEIIELSAVRIRNNEQVDITTTFVKPSRPVDDIITHLTGITNEMLENAPSIEEIIEPYINYIGNDIIVGHNVCFDINFLYDNYKKYCNKNFCNDFIDTYRISKKVCNTENHKLTTIAQHYGINTAGHHRAENDCVMTYHVYNALKQQILEKYSSVDEFYRQNWFSSLNRFNSETLTPETTNFDTSHILYNKVCTFTGTLSKMKRKDAMQAVVNVGGKVSDGLTKITNFLILGEQDYQRTKENGKSNKMLQAEKYILEGYDIKIIPEDLFYEFIEQNG